MAKFHMNVRNIIYIYDRHNVQENQKYTLFRELKQNRNLLINGFAQIRTLGL